MLIITHRVASVERVEFESENFSHFPVQPAQPVSHVSHVSRFQNNNNNSTFHSTSYSPLRQHRSYQIQSSLQQLQQPSPTQSTRKMSKILNNETKPFLQLDDKQKDQHWLEEKKELIDIIQQGSNKLNVNTDSTPSSLVFDINTTRSSSSHKIRKHRHQQSREQHFLQLMSKWSQVRGTKEEIHQRKQMFRNIKEKKPAQPKHLNSQVSTISSTHLHQTPTSTVLPYRSASTERINETSILTQPLPTRSLNLNSLSFSPSTSHSPSYSPLTSPLYNSHSFHFPQLRHSQFDTTTKSASGSSSPLLQQLNSATFALRRLHDSGARRASLKSAQNQQTLQLQQRSLSEHPSHNLQRSGSIENVLRSSRKEILADHSHHSAVKPSSRAVQQQQQGILLTPLSNQSSRPLSSESHRQKTKQSSQSISSDKLDIQQVYSAFSELQPTHPLRQSSDPSVPSSPTRSIVTPLFLQSTSDHYTANINQTTDSPMLSPTLSDSSMSSYSSSFQSTISSPSTDNSSSSFSPINRIHQQSSVNALGIKIAKSPNNENKEIINRISSTKTNNDHRDQIDLYQDEKFEEVEKIEQQKETQQHDEFQQPEQEAHEEQEIDVGDCILISDSSDEMMPIEESRLLLVDYFGSSSCHLFSSIPGCLRVTADELDSMLIIGFSLQSLIDVLLSLDESDERYDCFDSLLSTVQLRWQQHVNSTIDQKTSFSCFVNEDEEENELEFNNANDHHHHHHQQQQHHVSSSQSITLHELEQLSGIVGGKQNLGKYLEQLEKNGEKCLTMTFQQLVSRLR